MVNGKEKLFFSGYNYLGVNHHPDFLELIAQGISRYGWLFPSSRISNTRLALFEECESLLSSITGSEETVLLTSGYTAGRMAIQGKHVQNAPGSHPAILQSNSGYSTFQEWKNQFGREWSGGDLGSSAIASDTVNPLTATVYNFSFLEKIRSPLTVVLDDSHGIGVIGDGRGICGLVPGNQKLNYIFSYSLSKAFGIMGGAISCSSEEAVRIRLQPEYAAVTPLSPAQLFAFIKGQQIYSGQLEKLKKNMETFAGLIHKLPGVHHSPDFPVFVLDSRYQEEDFLQDDIVISSFAYPDPYGEKLNRIVINALHTAADLERLAACLQKISCLNKKTLMQ